jgi:hypothetical protein
MLQKPFTKPVRKMTTWGTDDLTQFLERVAPNQRGNREKFADPFSRMQRIDSCFVRAGKNLVNPTSVLKGVLFLRSQYAYKTAVGMTLPGQAAATFVMLRVGERRDNQTYWPLNIPYGEVPFGVRMRASSSRSMTVEPKLERMPWPRRGVEPSGVMMARTLWKARQPGRMISRTMMVSSVVSEPSARVLVTRGPLRSSLVRAPYPVRKVVAWLG